MAIKTVAIVALGTPLHEAIAEALLRAGFTVTIIMDHEPTLALSSTFQIRQVPWFSDPEFYDELKAAFKGQDAVVCSAQIMKYLALGRTPALAASAAGVKRFVALFEHDHNRLGRFPEGEKLVELQTRIKFLADIMARRAEGNPSFSWTGIATSMLLDSGLEGSSLHIHPMGRWADIFDSGNAIWSCCTRSFIGWAVAQALRLEDQTKNKCLEVVEYQTSQNEVVKALEEEIGVKFELHQVPTQYLKDQARRNLRKCDASAAEMNYRELWAFADGKKHAVPAHETANEMLGLPEPRRDVRAVVKEYVASMRA